MVFRFLSLNSGPEALPYSRLPRACNRRPSAYGFWISPGRFLQFFSKEPVSEEPVPGIAGISSAGICCALSSFAFFKRITESSFFIYNQYAVRTEPGDFFLSGQGLQKIIHHDNKSDGGSFLPEVLQKIVITPALGNCIPDSIGVGLEDHASIIMVLAQKPQVKGNITFHPIFTQDPVQFLQPFCFSVQDSSLFYGQTG